MDEIIEEIGKDENSFQILKNKFWDLDRGLRLQPTILIYPY